MATLRHTQIEVTILPQINVKYLMVSDYDIPPYISSLKYTPII